jgi:hypothetical protein
MSSSTRDGSRAASSYGCGPTVGVGNIVGRLPHVVTIHNRSNRLNTFHSVTRRPMCCWLGRTADTKVCTIVLGVTALLGRYLPSTVYTVRLPYYCLCAATPTDRAAGGYCGQQVSQPLYSVLYCLHCSSEWLRLHCRIRNQGNVPSNRLLYGVLFKS